VYNAGGSCPAGSTCGTHPKLTNMTLSAFDAQPMSGSPVIDKVSVLAGVTTDFVLAPRPYGAASDIGAYEYGSTSSGGGTPPPAPTPTPTCSRGTPTVSVAGPTAAVASGTAQEYTVTVRNNDSAECAAKTFYLADTVPTGWTGTLAGNVYLSPGASTTATLSVTSAVAATAGSYGIGVGVSSSEGPVHTASASVVYVVGLRIPPVSGSLPPVPATTIGTSSSPAVATASTSQATSGTRTTASSYWQRLFAAISGWFERFSARKAGNAARAWHPAGQAELPARTIVAQYPGRRIDRSPLAR
jgi:hypothetical protein